MSNYFKSLDKIEETIHFLEHNLNSSGTKTLSLQKDKEEEEREEEEEGRKEEEGKEGKERGKGGDNDKGRRRRDEEGKEDGTQWNEKGREESPVFFKESDFAHTNEFLENSLQPTSFQVTPEKSHMDSGSMIQIKRLFFDQEEGERKRQEEKELNREEGRNKEGRKEERG